MAAIHILISEVFSGLDDDGRHFHHVNVSIDDRKSDLRRIESPWRDEDEKELNWYLEVYASASGSPFERARAEKCHATIQEYASKLYQQLFPEEHPRYSDRQVVIDVEAASFRTTFFDLHWEALEYSPLSQTFTAVHVRRCFQSCGRVVKFDVPVTVLNILLVTARPKQDDIDYLLVSQRLVAAVVKAEGSQPLINIDIVRPGTWQALVKKLDSAEKECGHGYYQVVHFDVHGLRIDEGERRGVYLTFLDKSGTMSLYKRAETVAEKLLQHGVKGVVLNSCRSSSNGQSDYSSLTASFVQTDIPMVLGMKANISSGAIEVFTSEFYKAFLNERCPWHIAASRARADMAKHRTRNARFGQTVECDDWLVPTLYCSQDVHFVSPQSDSAPSTWSFSGLITALRSAEQHIDRIKKIFHNPEPSVPLVLGRDAMILKLENTLLLPFKPATGGTIWRKHIHMHGIAGSGKTALMRYLSWWWKLTRLVDESIYLDCHDIEPWSTESFLNRIYKSMHGILPTKTLTIDAVASEIAKSPFLLILDHVEILSMLPSAISDDEQAELTQFLGIVARGKALVFTISRNSTEAWLAVPRGLIYPFRVGSLSSPAALRLALHDIKDNPYDGEEHEALESLLDRQDHMPAGIRSIMTLLRENDLKPTELLHTLTSTTHRSLNLDYHGSKIGREIHTAMLLFARSVIAKTTMLESSLELILALAAFRRRVPPDFLAYWFFRRCYQREDQGVIQHLGVDAAASIMTFKNRDIIARYITAEDARSFHQLWAVTFRGLQTIGVVWPERLQTSGGHAEQYWHLHPLFTMTIQLYVTNGDFFNEKMHQPHIGKINARALASYYEQRMLDFEHSDAALAEFSMQRVLFELDSISQASKAWLDMWMAKGMQSYMLVKLTQMFNLNRLEKRDYRLLLAMFQRAVEFYEQMQDGLEGITEMGEVPLENFCVAAGKLQNSAFSVNDWSNVRNYNARIIRMLERNPTTVQACHYAQASYAQAKMVAAFEVKSREAYKRAAVMFGENLARPDIDDSILSRQIGNAKIRFMNQLGTLQCEMEREDVHIRELEVLHARLKDGVAKYVKLCRSAKSLHGWTEDDQLLLGNVDLIAEAIQLRRMAAAETSPDEIVDVFTDLLKRQVSGHREKQGTFVTLYNVLSSKENWRTKDSRAASLLDGYESAVRDNADTSTLASYLVDITLIHIKGGKYEAALECHEQWRKLVNPLRNQSDTPVLAYEAYAYALCYEGLEQRDLAKRYLARAMDLTRTEKNDKFRLGCLEVHAMIEAEDGNYRPALAAICEAGLLAYDRDSDANYDEHGLLLKLGFKIFMHACAGSKDDKADVQAHLANLAKQAKGELPPGPLPTSTIWESRERPSELLKYLMGLVGMRRGANVMLAFSKGQIYDENAEVKWSYVENLCFQHFAEERAKDAPFQAIPDIERDAAEAAQVVGPMLMVLVGNSRDERKRTVFWHLCGGTQPQGANIPANVFTLLENLGGVDSDERLSAIRTLADDASIETFDDHGTTVVMHVLAQGADQAANLLIELGADINAVDFMDESALHHAVQAQDLGRVELCLRLGSRTSQKNAQGSTPLALAVQQENYDICHVLIHHGANVLARDNVGRTCILLAAIARQFDNLALCFKTLIPFGKDLCRRILLDHGFAHENYIDLFLKDPADVDDGKYAFSESLFQLPQDLEVPNRAGLTSYHMAVMNAGCSEALLEAVFVGSEANADLRDSSLFGMTPMHLLFSRDDPIGTLKIMNGDPDLETLHGGLKSVALIAMGGLTMSIGDQEINLPERRRLQLKIATAWRQSCDKLLYSNVGRKGLEWMADLKRQLAFNDEASEQLKQGGMGQYPMQAAIFEMGFEQAKPHDNLVYRDPATGKAISRIAARAKQFEDLLTRTVNDEDPEELLRLREEIVWKGNANLFPQVYHIDRHGRCRYVQPAAEREDQTCRVWVVDGDGNHKGVIGTVDWDVEGVRR